MPDADEILEAISAWKNLIEWAQNDGTVEVKEDADNL